MIQERRLGRGRGRYWSFTRELFVLYFAIRDKRTPLHARFIAIFSILYLISPIDLIPDFIPVAGYLDDLIIVPLLLHIAFRLLPAEVKESGWEKARKQIVKLRIALFILILLMILLLAGSFFLIRALFHHL